MDQEEIQMKIKLYCRPEQVFELSVGPQTTLGEIVEALKENADIYDLPPVDKLTYIDYWKTSAINSETIVGKLVPYKQQFQIQITYQQAPKSNIQFFPQQSGFHISQQSSIMASEVLDTIMSNNSQKLDQMFSQGSINEHDLQIAKKLQQKNIQIEELNKAIDLLAQYSKRGDINLNVITNKTVKSKMTKFFNEINNQSVIKSNDAFLSMENASKQLQRKHRQELNVLQIKNQKSQQQLVQLKKKLKQIQKNNKDKLEVDVKKLQEINKNQKLELKSLNEQNHQLKKQSEEFKEQIQKLKAQASPKKFRPLGPILPKSNITVSKTPLSISEILAQKDTDGHLTQFLLKSLTDFEKKEVKKMKLVYKLDEFNKTNFHNYLDGKNNLFMLIQTQNNKLFGAFLEEGLSDDESYGNAYLFSANQKLIFAKQKAGEIAHSNEAFRIILGKDDIIINPYNLKVTISKRIFKQNSSFYSQEAKKYDIFTGQVSNTEIKIQSFEAYQVSFIQ